MADRVPGRRPPAFEAPRRLRKVDVHQLLKRLQTVIAREVDGLMAASHKKRLNDKDAKTAVMYFRLLAEMEQLELIKSESKAEVSKA